MRGRAQALDIGPFAGGLNATGNPHSIADNELVQLVNLNVALDGSLYTRPPFASVPLPGGVSGHPYTNFKVLLRFEAGFETRLLISCNFGLYVLSIETGLWSLVRMNPDITYASNPWFTAVLYNGVIYISGSDRGRINASVSYSWIADPDIPITTCFVVHRSRIFAIDAANDSRIVYSSLITAAAPTATWNYTTQWFDVSRGDTQLLTYIMPYNNDLLIFKQNSTYLFLYDLDIQTEGTIRLLSSTIGGSVNTDITTNTGIVPAVSYQNSVFVYHEQKLYELAGYNFIEVNVKTPFPTIPRSISILDDFVIAVFDTFMYAYFVPTKTWSRWESTRPFNLLVGASRKDGTRLYYGGGLGHNSNYLIATTMAESLGGTSTEPLTVTFRTKSFDFTDSFHYKKLMWWLLSFASPSAGQQGTISVSAVAEEPYSSDVIVTDTVVPSLTARQTIARFMKTFRFKRIYFIVSQSGIAYAGPRTRFFKLGAAVAQKQTLSKKGN